MKVWYIIISFIVLIVVLTVISTNIIIGATKQLESNLTRIHDYNNYTLAKSSFRDTIREWKKYKKQLAVLIEHQEIDSIEEQIAKTKELLEQGNKDLLLSELSTLKFYVNHVKDMALLKIENIF
ncbi:DUF4363 family protein [Caldicellulosiruptor naganoensis]|uniref:DUF4363 family protein n=1 Tax=Caldicellulosiruptor naganoensis TaxID=29324 RepID=A0ABY7BMG9_9FIRM|nr:DUF4363 family protein [Caldicellulosiruptor naganoensis]WAM32589.1 DUF4363 family protein [Caldicellulosiruptor naganoensis]